MKKQLALVATLVSLVVPTAAAAAAGDATLYAHAKKHKPAAAVKIESTCGIVGGIRWCGMGWATGDAPIHVRYAFAFAKPVPAGQRRSTANAIRSVLGSAGAEANLRFVRAARLAWRDGATVLTWDVDAVVS